MAGSVRDRWVTVSGVCVHPLYMDDGRRRVALMSVKAGILEVRWIFAAAALSSLILGPHTRADEIIARRTSADAKLRLVATSAVDRHREFWSFRPCKRPEVPVVFANTWGKTPVDSFLLAKMQVADVTPAPPASRTTLLRRVYYDLV